MKSDTQPVLRAIEIDCEDTQIDCVYDQALSVQLITKDGSLEPQKEEQENGNP